MPIAVIPVGRGRPTTLPYVLRSLAANAEVDEVVTVGEQPEGIDPDLHIESPNAGKPHQNIAGHLRRVCAELADPFIWCDDDTFTLRPWTPGVYVRPFSIAHFLRKNPNRGQWSIAVRASIKVMTEWGYDPDTVPCGTVHRPWLVDPDRALDTVAALDKAGGGSFKALYVAGLEGTIESEDNKIVGNGTIKPGADVVSLFTQSWRGNAGRIVREMFPEPSAWEVPPSGTAESVGGRVASGRRRRT